MKTIELIGRQLNQEVFPHAFLFSGINHDQKNEAVELIISKLLGKNYAGNPDFYEINNEKIPIEEIRNLKARAMETAVAGEYKVFLIKEVQNLTWEAVPALLKILEEPPPKTVFLATTTNANEVSPILKSRFSHFRFHLDVGRPNALGRPTSKWDFEQFQKLPYQKRFQEIQKILDCIRAGRECGGFATLIREALLEEMKDFRKNFKNPDKISRLLQIQKSAADPTANKKLLGEYLAMII